MKTVVWVSFLILIMFGSAMPQSGRSSTPVASPTPAIASIPSEYSESSPRPGRNSRFENRFPNKQAPPPVSTSPRTPAPAQTTGSDEVLKVDTNLITIPVSVFDKNGLYIPGLKQGNFKIFEDGVEQEIAYFGAQDKPFTVALVLDMSLSSEYKIDEIRAAASAFVERLEPRDRVIVIDFNSDIHVRTKPTNDKQTILKAIAKADFGSGTSLYNAVDEALRKQLAKIPGRKAVVLFTDGVDTTSRKNSYESTLTFAEEADSLVFPIYYNTFLDVQGQEENGTLMAGTRQEDYDLGKKYLDDLADATGGRIFRPESTPGGLRAAFEGIAEELRRQYNIGYVPSTEGTVGQRRQIKVRVNRPNLVLRSRDSYVVGSAGNPSPSPAKK